MRGVHGERGLADAGHPVDRGDHHGRAGVQQPLQVTAAAGEVRQVVRQRARWPRPVRLQRRVRPQDLLVQPDQLGARVEAQLVGEAVAQVGVARQGLGLAAGGVQGAQVQSPQVAQLASQLTKEDSE